MAACRLADPSAGAVDSRMAAYLDGVHHPHQALQPRVAYLAIEDHAVVGYIAGHLTRRYECEGAAVSPCLAATPPVGRRQRTASPARGLVHAAGGLQGLRRRQPREPRGAAVLPAPRREGDQRALAGVARHPDRRRDCHRALRSRAGPQRLRPRRSGYGRCWACRRCASTTTARPPCPGWPQADPRHPGVGCQACSRWPPMPGRSTPRDTSTCRVMTTRCARSSIARAAGHTRTTFTWSRSEASKNGARSPFGTTFGKTLRCRAGTRAQARS